MFETIHFFKVKICLIAENANKLHKISYNLESNVVISYKHFIYQFRPISQNLLLILSKMNKYRQLSLKADLSLSGIETLSFSLLRIKSYFFVFIVRLLNVNSLYSVRDLHTYFIKSTYECK